MALFVTDSENMHADILLQVILSELSLVMYEVEQRQHMGSNSYIFVFSKYIFEHSPSLYWRFV